jgi:hypothetical protein
MKELDMFRSFTVALMLMTTPAIADVCKSHAEFAEYVAIARDRGMTAEEVAQVMFGMRIKTTKEEAAMMRALISMVYSNALLSPEEIYGKATALCWIATNQ